MYWKRLCEAGRDVLELDEVEIKESRTHPSDIYDHARASLLSLYYVAKAGPGDFQDAPGSSRLAVAAHHRCTMFTTVAHYTDPIEAHLARGRLVSEGIDAHLGDEHLAMANWEWRLAVGGVKLRVADCDAERARRVLQAIDAGEYVVVKPSSR